MNTLTITSGKGGVGKTNLALGLGLALAERGRSCVVVDADVGLANLNVVAGVVTGSTLEDVLSGEATVDQAMIDFAPKLRLIPASSGQLHMERLGPEEHQRLGELIGSLSKRFDYVLIDTGAGMTENVLFFAGLADRVAVVTLPEPPALTDAYAVTKVLHRHARASQFSLIVNQVTTAGHSELVYERMRGVCTAHLGLNLHYLGYVLADPAVPRAVQARRPFFAVEPEAPASRCLRSIAAKVTDL